MKLDRVLMWLDDHSGDLIIGVAVLFFVSIIAIADTHPKGGDVQQAPSLMSGGGAEGNRPNSIGTS